MKRFAARAAAAAAMIFATLLAVPAGLAQAPKGEAVKFYIMIDVPDQTNLLALDRWYITYHSQQMHRAMRLWQRNYISYRSYTPPPEADRYHVWRGRLTEIQFDSIDDFREGRANNPFLDLLTPPPGGWAHPIFRSQPVTIPINPQETYLMRPTPVKETPYLRWIIFSYYPKGVSQADGDMWFEETHVKEMSQVPGLKKYIGYRAVSDAEAPKGAAAQNSGVPARSGPTYGRVEELWFDDYASWRKAFIEAPPKLTAPPWGGASPYYEYISTFIGENPDVDFLNDRRVIP